jgi:hypothetical protein
MSQMRRNSRGQRINNHVYSSAQAGGAPGRLAVVILAVLCMAFWTLMTHSTPPVRAATDTPASRALRAAMLRQLQAGESLYRIDTPVRLEETTVRVMLASPDVIDWNQWQFFDEPAADESSGASSVAEILQFLKGLGDTTVLHGGVCVLTNGDPVALYSGKRVPQTTGVAGGPTPSMLEYRDLGRRLTAHLEGMDAEERICFSYSIDLNYIEGERDTAAGPSYVSFNAEGRAKLSDGETLVIPNFDGPRGLVVLLTPRIMK